MTQTPVQADPFSQPVDTTADILRNGRYYLPELDKTQPGWVGTAKRGGRTRVTTFAKALSDNYALDAWEKRMVARGLVLREDLYALVAAVDMSDPASAKKELDRLVRKAKEAAGGEEGANLGIAFHGFTEQIDRGQTPRVPAKYRGMMASYQATMEAYGLTVVPGWLERRVVCERYNLAGTLDRLYWTPSRRIVVGDVKSQKQFWSWEEISIQLACYSNADAAWDPELGIYIPMPEELDRDLAVVVWMPLDHPEGKDIVDVFNVPLERAWEFAAKTAADARSWRNEGKKLGYLRPMPDLARMERWAQRLQEAVTREELSQVYQEANTAGEWTTELEAVGMLTLARLDA